MNQRREMSGGGKQKGEGTSLHPNPGDAKEQCYKSPLNPCSHLGLLPGEEE